MDDLLAVRSPGVLWSTDLWVVSHHRTKALLVQQQCSDNTEMIQP